MKPLTEEMAETHAKLAKEWDKNRIKAQKDDSFADAAQEALKLLRLFEHNARNQGYDIGYYYP